MAIVQSHPNGTVLHPAENISIPLPDGSIKRVHHIEGLADQYRGDPGAFDEIEVDYALNKAVIDDLRADPDSYRLIAGELTKDGNPVSLVADGDELRYLKAARQYVLDVRSGDIKSEDNEVRLEKLEHMVAVLAMQVLDRRVR